MKEQTAAILIRDPRGIGAKLPLVEGLHRCGRRFDLFFIGFGPRELNETERARVNRLRERGVDLYTHSAIVGPCGGFCRGDARDIAGRLERAEMVIPL